MSVAPEPARSQSCWQSVGAARGADLGLPNAGRGAYRALVGLGKAEGLAQAEAPAEPLTEHDQQVLQLLAQGLANKQIAASLSISEHTVKFHVSGIYAKLGAASRTEAVRLGVQQGLVVL